MADAENLGDRGHRQPLAVGGANGLVAPAAELFLAALEGGLLPGVVAGEGGEFGAGVG